MPIDIIIVIKLVFISLLTAKPAEVPAPIAIPLLIIDRFIDSLKEKGNKI